MPALSQAGANTRRRQLFSRSTWPFGDVNRAASTGRPAHRLSRLGNIDGGTETSRIRCVFGVVQTNVEPTTETLARISRRRLAKSKSPTRSAANSPKRRPVTASSASSSP
jgi:hypothetical protein